MIYQSIIYTATAILLVLIIVKTGLFFARITHRTLGKWFYFSSYAIENSRSEKSRSSKKVQNTLTVIIAIIAAIDAVLVFLFHSLI